MKFHLSPKLIFLCLTIYLTNLHQISYGQYKTSTYGAVYLDNTKFYEGLVNQNSVYLLEDIHSKIPSARYDLRYSTTNNFTGQVLYPPTTQHSFLSSDALVGLQKAAAYFDSLGYDIVVFDSYRPYSVTVQFWELIKDEDYVAIPTKGSMHNRGLAIDLSLWDRKNNQLLDMGTDFDHFTDSAHHAFTGFSEEVLKNRIVLKDAMIRFGFRPIKTEWWHYIWNTETEHPVLDLDFKTLLKVQQRSSKKN